MSRRVAAAALLVAGALACSTTASADVGNGLGQGTGGVEGGVLVATVLVDTPGSSGASSHCSWTLADGPVGAVTWPITVNGVVYHFWQRACPDGVTFVAVPERQPQDLLPDLLSQLRERALPKPVPVFEMLDKDFGWAYVRTPLDFRAGDAWRPISVTASLGPVWATVTATPLRLTFDPGDPRGPGPVTCEGDGPLAPYASAEPGACSYRYVNASSTSPFDHYHFQTRLTIDWSIAWTSSTGASGSLPPYSTSTDSLLAVAEIKALVTCTGPAPEQGGC
jgi:hypothetical protein